METGLVTARAVGNQRHYQANRESPVFAELRSLITKTVALIDALRIALTPLASRIALALVYGSVARGEGRAGSDVGLLVVSDSLTLEELFERLHPVEKALERKISPTLYKSADFRRRRDSRNPFLEKVLAGEMIFLIGSEEDVTRATGNLLKIGI